VSVYALAGFFFGIEQKCQRGADADPGHGGDPVEQRRTSQPIGSAVFFRLIARPRSRGVSIKEQWLRNISAGVVVGATQVRSV
jgi:hypothetical protein